MDDKVPKKNPKHQAQLNRIIAEEHHHTGGRIRNWKKIGGSIIVVSLVCLCIGLLIYYYNPFTPTANKIQEGDRVYIYYTLTAANGSVIDQSPTSGGTYFADITKGAGGVIPGFTTKSLA